MLLVDFLIQDGWLKTERIINAFKEIKRKDFLPEEVGGLAELNEALPIGFRQTISQPLVVAFMLEFLQPKEGEKILDVGSGSGWTSALLADIISQKRNPKSQYPNPNQIQNYKSQIKNGKVIAIELVPELKEFGEKNVSKYGFIENGAVEFVLGDGSRGYSKEAPYDKILASASGDKLPDSWTEQLKIGGRIVCPIKSSIWLFIKKSKNEFEEKEFQGFSFVPLVSNSEK
jgi:protein-L-isoaspartate(D-aspartate) O-methyltransferase